MLSRNFISIAVFLCYLLPLYSFTIQLQTDSRFRNGILSMCDPVDAGDSPALTWSNPAYSKEELSLWWAKADKSLISIGSKGVQQSHVNSLLEMLKSHERVRVKIASDKLNSIATAASFMDNEMILNDAELLECRSRGFLVGRTASTPVQKRKPGWYRDPEWYKKGKE